MCARDVCMDYSISIEVGLEVDLSSALHVALLTTALILPLGLTVIIGCALRPVRERYHNAWEYTHRYVGWFADLIIHLVIKALTLASPVQLFYTSLPYLTAISVVSIFYVWFTVRHARISIRANKSVAVLTFPGTPTMRSGTFARISRDGRERHAFSVAMTDFEKKEFSLIVARAGDWTTKLITDVLNRRGPGRMWIRGVQAPGFMYMHRAYKKGERGAGVTGVMLRQTTLNRVTVVTVCTGAGIAPALPHIEQATSNIMLIWIVKNHRKTYGEAVWKAVTSNLPAHQLILHDTGESGRPDIGSLIERAVKAHDAEAVFVVSNDPYTQLRASICRRKGLRCYGANRDS
ncbi:hypothetical protein FRC07_000255 [Ceratobasidium sp. 392]|nr:hypothetical protein FRC07_000255 [Ceratobasidium sp. 392]